MLQDCLINEKENKDSSETLNIRKYNINVHLCALEIINIARKYLDLEKINFIQYNFVYNHKDLFNFNK